MIKLEKLCQKPYGGFRASWKRDFAPGVINVENQVAPRITG